MINIQRSNKKKAEEDTENDSSRKSTKKMRTTVDEDESMQSQRALSSIFGMESDDDEDENSELTMSRIPETQDNLAKTSDEIHTSSGIARASPDLFDMSESIEPGNKRKTCSLDKSTSPLTNEVSSSKRLKVTIDSEVNVETKTEKFYIQTSEVNREKLDQKPEADLDIIEVPVIVSPLLKKSLNRPTFTESVDGTRRVKNFKRFHKALPCGKNRQENAVSTSDYKLTFVPYTDPTDTDFNVCPSPDQVDIHEEDEDSFEQEDILFSGRNSFGDTRVQQPPRSAVSSKVPALPVLHLSQEDKEDSIWDF